MIDNLHISNYTQHSVEFISIESVIYSGNEAVDKLIGCFKPGELICFAGSGGNGKSTLLRSIIYNLVIDQNIPSGYFCSEGICKEKIVFQYLCAIAKISFSSWSLPALTMDENCKIEQAKIILDNSPLYANLYPSISIKQIEDDTEQLVKDKNVKIIFVDNLQGIKSDNPKNKILEISLRLKRLAQRLNIPIIVTSYLNWWIWEREGFERRIPHLSDLAHVGDLNDIADIVLGVYRPELDHISVDELGNELKGKIRIDVLKSYRSKLNFKYLQFGKFCLSFE